MTEPLLGLLAGIGFGFLFQKSRILRFDKQIGLLLFRDLTVLKFMLSAIVVGMVGFHLLHVYGLLTVHRKTMSLGAVLVGGILFGAGWPLCGYTPGTAVAALGEGRWRAGFVLAGMLAGVLLFVWSEPWLQRTVPAWYDLGELSLPQLIGLPEATVVALFVGLVTLFFWWTERKGR